MMRSRHVTAVAGLLIALAGCDRGAGTGAPPRADDPVPQPKLVSTISVPLDADPRALQRAVERAVPKVLWSIHKREPQCLSPQRVRLFGRNVKVTPAIPCVIVGEAVRGPIRLRGVGREIHADVPINARITARDVKGVLKGETATGTALARAIITLDLGPDWKPRGMVRLSYDWTTPPGIDFLGQRISFTEQADEKLRPVARQLERTLPAELAKIDMRSRVEPLWRRGFTTVELNHDRPPVWMRITPRRLRYDSYALRGASLRLNLAMDAVTETFVGPRPADPTPTALPPLATGHVPKGLSLFIPVIADYAQLQPVIMRALMKRSQRPFDLPAIGPVGARLERAVIYATTGHRIAVGLTLTAWPIAKPNDNIHGTIWLTATPVNTPGSARVRFKNLALAGDSDRAAGELLIALGNSPAVVDAIAGALGQNFTGDLDKLVAKVSAAIADKPIDDFRIQAHLKQVETGRIAAFGQGLYLPVRVSGDARISYRPR